MNPTRSVVPEVAEVSVVLETESAVPSASDLLGTMRYWDEYRRNERARLDALGLREAVELTPAQAREHLTVGEFPDGEKLRELSEKLFRQRLGEERRATRRLSLWQKFLTWKRVTFAA